MLKRHTLLFAASICLCVATQAEVSLGAAGNSGIAGKPGGARSTMAPAWPGALDAVPGAGEDIAKDLPSESKLLTDHLNSAEAPGRSNVLKALIAMPGQAAGVAPANPATPKTEAANLGNELFDAIKQGVKPVKEQIANSELVQTVRELDANLSGQPASAEGLEPANNPGYSAGAHAPSREATTAEQAQRNKITSDLAIQQLIEEIKPWVLGLAGLLALGYLATAAWSYLAWKNKRRSRQRRSSGNSRRSAEGADKTQQARRSQNQASSASGRREQRKHRNSAKPVLLSVPDSPGTDGMRS